jgi:hypothetical protein
MRSRFFALVGTFALGCALTGAVGCSSGSEGTGDASVNEAHGAFTAAPPQASKNPQVTGVEQWVPANVETEAGAQYVVFFGYAPGASDADLKDPYKATYAIVWGNDGEDHVAIGWADLNRQDPLQLSHDQLLAFADDVNAIGETTASVDGTVKPQGIVGNTAQLLGPCGTAQLSRAAAIVGTLLTGAGSGLMCVYGMVYGCIGGLALTYEFAKDTIGMNQSTHAACRY